MKKYIYLKYLLTRILISIILVLIISIFIKYNDNNIEYINKYLFKESIHFNKINNLFNKSISNIIKEDNSNILVSNIDNLYNLEYSSSREYTTFNTGSDYIVNSLSSGTLVYKGNIDNYEDVIIIQGNDLVDIWYIGIKNSNVNLYDYISKNTIIGTTKEEELKIKLLKDGNLLSYEEYIK